MKCPECKSDLDDTNFCEECDISFEECVSCGSLTDEDELDEHHYCYDCQDQYECRTCGCPSDDLDDDGICYECNREHWIDYCQGRDEAYD